MLADWLWKRKSAQVKDSRGELPNSLQLGCFLLSAALFLQLDRFSDHVTGALVNNTVGAGPTPVIQENIVTTGGFPGGTINTRSSRQYVIEGYIFTSHGLVDTTVTQKIDFSNFQQFTISASQFIQDINPNTARHNNQDAVLVWRPAIRTESIVPIDHGYLAVAER